jgi:molybdopterin molybdotransferase
MDGYAARVADLTSGQPLPIAFEVPAGEVPPVLPDGAVARIFTGAWLPEGADVVVPQEEARKAPDGRILLSQLQAGTFIRRQGEVCRAGAALAQAGDLVTPQLLGLLVAIGPRRLQVVPRPRIGIMNTGSEVLDPSAALRPGCIYDSNGPMLAALARQVGLHAVFTLRVADDLQSTCRVIEQAASQVELVATSGGVSVGDYDLVPEALQRLGAEVIFHRVLIKPGKPILVARLGRCVIVGLPGNPASAFVGWHMFAKPLADRLAGKSDAFDCARVRARLVTAAANRGDRTLLAPARLTSNGDTSSVSIVPWKGSHDIVAVARSNALAILEVGANLGIEDTVECIPTCDGQNFLETSAHAQQTQPS